MNTTFAVNPMTLDFNDEPVEQDLAEYLEAQAYENEREEGV